MYYAFVNNDILIRELLLYRKSKDRPLLRIYGMHVPPLTLAPFIRKFMTIQRTFILDPVFITLLKYYKWTRESKKSVK